MSHLPPSPQEPQKQAPAPAEQAPAATEAGPQTLAPPPFSVSAQGQQDSHSREEDGNEKEEGGDGEDVGGRLGIVKKKMSSALNSDFSQVKIHQNSKEASEMGALAFTRGENVHFAPGQFSPESLWGQELIGHEFAHVVQQRNGNVTPTT